MIIDHIGNSKLYTNLGSRIATTFKYLLETDFSKDRYTALIWSQYSCQHLNHCRFTRTIRTNEPYGFTCFDTERNVILL